MFSLRINLLIVVATFFFMEAVAWFTHKYIMHGILWSWHKSHHTYHKEPLEKNDLFGVVFSVPAVLLIIVGSEVPDVRFLLYVGLGVTAYGIFYVLFHDILVHRRVKIKFKAASPYLKRMMRDSLYPPQKTHERRLRSLWFFVCSQEV